MTYFLPLIFLSIFAILEDINKFSNLIKNKYLYIFITLFFIFFIGLRYEVGCDWDAYNWHFNNISSSSFLDLFKNKEKYYDLGHAIITKLISLKSNYYAHNLIYAIFFVIPLIIFSSQIKRTFLTLVIAYPYYVVVVGMGSIRQAACISFLFLSFLLIKKNKYSIFYFITVISYLIHQSSILINGIIFLKIIPLIDKKRRIYKYLFIAITFVVLVFTYEFLANKVYTYIYNYEKVLNPAKSAILIWVINFLPAILFLKYKIKFKFNKELKKIFSSICIFEIILLPLIFFNSVVAYRLLIYFYPFSIYITSQLPELNIIKFDNKLITSSIILLAYGALCFWLRFASHSYCYLPYRNLLLN